MKSISKTELKFISGILIFLIAIFLLFKFTTAFSFVETLNPIWQFLIMNIGIYFIIYYVIRYFASGKVAIKGSSGLLLLFLAIDNITPEWHVSIAGVITKGAEMGMATTDYFFGYVWSLIGVSGVWLFVFTYGVTTIVLLSVSAYLEKDFVKRLG